MIKTLKDALCCPTCRERLVYGKRLIYCPNCKKDVLQEGRLLDFSIVTPNLPLELGKYNQALHENAGHAMKDIEPDWRINAVLREIRQNVQGTVCLEIGGGDGPMTPELEKLYDIVLTIDFSKTFLKRIESKTTKTICLFGDGLFLPIQNETVDTVVCSEVLEHVTIPTQLLTEIRRVMNKSAICILSVPNESRLRLHRKRKLAQLPAGDTHINFFTPETLQKLLFRTGFEIVDNKTLLPPNSSVKELLRNTICFIRNGFYGSFLLCTLKVMENPYIYWESFYEKIYR